MKADLPNLLTAASILLAVITALYGLFFPSIKSVLDIEPKKHKADNKQDFINSKEIAKSKYLPLLLGAVIVTLIYLPELYRQIKGSLIILKTNGIKNISYDTLTASFITVCLFMISITIIIIVSGFKLNKKIKDLNPK